MQNYTMAGEQPISLIANLNGNLYLGNLDAAKDKQLLKNLNITNVLSICTEEIMKFDKRINHLSIEIRDQLGSDISRIFEQSYTFIDNALSSGQNVLVHCAAGISRSATIVIAYIMKKNKIFLQKAFKRVKDARPYIRPNPHFIKQLLDYERKIYGGIFSNLSGLTPYDMQKDPYYAPKKKMSLQFVKAPALINLSKSSVGFYK
ncbi:hypothetical protein pb186bvf_010093 [Paramecium bursaria]